MTDYRIAKGWLTPRERDYLRTLAAAVAPMKQPIVNVGIEYGASMHCLRAGAPNTLIVGVDLIGDGRFEGELDKALIVKGYSSDVAQMFRRNLFAMAFIDGGHSYTDAHVDAVLYSDLISVGGIIAFHDTDLSPAQEDVNRAVSHWLIEINTREIRPVHWVELQKVDSIRAFKRDE